MSVFFVCTQVFFSMLEIYNEQVTEGEQHLSFWFLCPSPVLLVNHLLFCLPSRCAGA